jgi:hypothetical protein
VARCDSLEHRHERGARRISSTQSRADLLKRFSLPLTRTRVVGQIAQLTPRERRHNELVMIEGAFKGKLNEPIR